MQKIEEVTATDIALAEMLIENTGRHMLDSGGAYGRNWERAQAATGVKAGEEGAGEAAARFFISRPEVTIELHGEYPDVTLDLFHYLRQRVTFLPDENKAFHDWAGEAGREREPWRELMAEWLEGREGFQDGFNSYNYESLLSQVIQGEVYEVPYPGSNVILLQVHGGADVRGGYTAPKLFTAGGGVAAGEALGLILGDCNTFELAGKVRDPREDRWAAWRGEWDLDCAPEEWLADADDWRKARIDFARFDNGKNPGELIHRETGEVVTVLAPTPTC